VLSQLLLQEVAWDENSRGRKRAERAAVSAQYDDIGDLQNEPLFCAETALKVAHSSLRWVSMLHEMLELCAGSDTQLASHSCRPLYDAGNRPLEAWIDKRNVVNLKLNIVGIPLDVPVLSV
jgi:hypothetical protein